ncbi:MAG: NAD(P)/FAD-dependent oxidoreductase [Candidatus Krumholzibacteriia bacterium]
MDDLQTRSYWLSLDEYRPEPPLSEDITVDVAMIGGGFTSLWAAYLMLSENPGLRVALLEASAIGYGASGRNGGFAMTLVHRTLSHLADFVGDEEARKIYLAAEQAVEHLNATIEKESIACDVQANGLLTLSNGEPQDRIIENEVATAERLGMGSKIRYLDKEAARERIHSDKIRCGFREEACTLVNPARLARGLKKVVMDKGAIVYEGTPVGSWEERSDRVLVRVPGATVTADRVLLAGNAYSTAWKPTRGSILPFYSYICLTRPLSDAEWRSVGWEGREGAEDRRVGLHYFRPTVDGRILWGGRDPVFHPDGPKASYDRDERVFSRMRESFEWFFPQLGEVAFEHRWGGPVGVTGNFLPCVGWFGSGVRRVAYAYGYNGHGVAIANLAAHSVADMFADRKSEWTDLWFVGKPPVGLGPRWLRDPLVRAMVNAQIKADDEEREIKDPLVVRVLNRLTDADLRIG